MSIELQTAIDKDMAVIHDDGTAEYVENNQQPVDDVVYDQELNEVETETSQNNASVNSEQMSIEEAFFN